MSIFDTTSSGKGKKLHFRLYNDSFMSYNGSIKSDCPRNNGVVRFLEIGGGVAVMRGRYLLAISLVRIQDRAPNRHNGLAIGRIIHV